MRDFGRREVTAGLAAALVVAGPARSATRIDDETYIPAGGLDQWITVHGDDAKNPVLLVVHGGPGDVIWPFRDRIMGWEKAFTVVQWDQRGAGKTFTRPGQQKPPMGLELIAADGVAVAQAMRRRFGKRRILLLGHSWGSMVATRMAQLQPDLFGAYIGTGQVASWAACVQAQFDYLLARAKARGDTAFAAELEAIGTPNPKDVGQYFRFTRGLRGQLPEPDRIWLADLRARMTATPGIGEAGLKALGAAMGYSGQGLLADMVAEDLTTSAPRFDLPYVLIQGREDITTPAPAALAYYAQVQAPRKALQVIEGAGHFAFLTHPEAFLAALQAKALPAARGRL
jgi:pimeloyl-ACP methyl ester carboxylesterase